MGKPWTAQAKLPGGDFLPQEFEIKLHELTQHYPFLDQSLLWRYFRYYGSEVGKLLAGVNKAEDLGFYFGADLYQREVEYLREYEFAETAEDIIWRRTKLALHMNSEQIEQLKQFMQSKT
jgi:glycerol-3-phosphate dehydrogenase